jgi:hypothetical protein
MSQAEANVGTPRENSRTAFAIIPFFMSVFYVLMSVGMEYFSNVGLVLCQRQKPTLRLRCCPHPGFMASKSKS